jgi:hypothetical protein
MTNWLPIGGIHVLQTYLVKKEAKRSLSIHCLLSYLWFVLVKEADHLLRRLKKDENGLAFEVKCQVQCLHGQGERKVLKESSKDIEKLEKHFVDFN